MKKLQKLGVYTLSFLSAASSGLQNYMAMVSLLKEIAHDILTLSKAGIGLIHGLATALGGLCGGIVNMCVNVELLESFMERLTQKPKPDLQGWQRLQYWFGSSIFVATGILFGLTTFAFGPMGPLTVLSIISGVLVATLMIIQELETWLASFDDPNENKKSLLTVFKEWKASLTKEKLLGIAIAVGNVVALSLLFTLGLMTFMTGVGIPALPAIIVSFTLAFTGGAFTEFYFYNRFLANFCNNLKENFLKFWHSSYSPLGLMTCGINALVNGVLSYVGITMLATLLVSVGVVVPPAGVVIAIAVSCAVFAGLASLILGLDFWERNSKKLAFIFGKTKVEEPAPAAEGLGTKNIFHGLKLQKPAPREKLVADSFTQAATVKSPAFFDAAPQVIAQPADFAPLVSLTP